jgi:CheY-like chemotaxis protein
MVAQTEISPTLEESVVNPGSHARILVADDDPYLVRLIRENLELEGYDVTCAFDGAQAIHTVQERRFDLIVLDVNMPMANGFKVLEYLRTRPDTEKTPVIVVTGEPSGDVYPIVARDPRASHIKKPLDIESLNSLVKHYLKR